MEILKNYKLSIRRYFNIKNRASRSEFWGFVLVNFVASLLLITLGQNQLYNVFSILTLIPSFTLMIRRLKDINLSGFNILWGIIPLFGPLILLIFSLRKGTEGENQYGFLTDEDDDFQLVKNIKNQKDKNVEREFNF